MRQASDPRRSAVATARNRDAILTVLGRILPASGLVLEVASGTGEHAAYFASRLPHLVWQPSEADASLHDSISAWARSLGAPNLRLPLHLDARNATWPIDSAVAVVCINMIHIAPWEACAGLMRGSSRTLVPDGILYLYGAYRRDGRHTAPSNANFDASLRARNATWGVRNLDDVVAEAALSDLALAEIVAMPANNLSVVFRRKP